MAVLRSLLLFFIMYSVVNAEDEKCPYGWTNFESNATSTSLSQLTGSPQRICQTHDANLASVHNKLENDLLVSLVPSHERFWVGAQDGEQEGQWIWSDGSTFDYSSWCSGELNNAGNAENCLELAYSSNHCWNDLTCSAQVPFVCAKNL